MSNANPAELPIGELFNATVREAALEVASASTAPEDQTLVSPTSPEHELVIAKSEAESVAPELVAAELVSAKIVAAPQRELAVSRAKRAFQKVLLGAAALVIVLTVLGYLLEKYDPRPVDGGSPPGSHP